MALAVYFSPVILYSSFKNEETSLHLFFSHMQWVGDSSPRGPRTKIATFHTHHSGVQGGAVMQLHPFLIPVPPKV